MPAATCISGPAEQDADRHSGYISLLCNNALPCSLADPRRGREALKLLVEAQPSQPLPARGQGDPHRERAGAGAQGAGR